VARRLQDFDFGKRQGNPKYPWDQWTDGHTWRVTHGKDYTCTTGSLVVYLYHKSNMLKRKVKVRVQRGIGRKPDRVVFQFVEDDAAEAAPVKKRLRKIKRKQA
jgi:hypothetical protein